MDEGEGSFFSGDEALEEPALGIDGGGFFTDCAGSHGLESSGLGGVIELVDELEGGFNIG